MKPLTIVLALSASLACAGRVTGGEPPWRAFGRVTDGDGKPMAGVQVWGSSGIGTLKRSGPVTSGEDGRYQLDFGPGVMFFEGDGAAMQAANVGARKPGFFEANLNRQGRGSGVGGVPTPEQRRTWGSMGDRVFVKGEPLEVNFVMRPAGRVSGKLVDAEGRPLPGYSVSLTGAALPPASSALTSCRADDQGRFTLEDIPTDQRFQFEVRKGEVKPPWDDTWASAALRFGKHDGDLLAWFGDREIRLREFVLRVSGPGVHGRTAVSVAGNRGVLDLAGEPSERGEVLIADSATLTLSNAKQDVGRLLIAGSIPAPRAHASETRLARTRPNAEGEFTISFEIPEGLKLEPGKHQVIFQVFAGKPVRERILRQLDIKAGRYEESVKIRPEWVEDSRVSITFVTIQPDHDAWVRRFFVDGKGTSYQGLWKGDGGMLPAIEFAGEK